MTTFQYKIVGWRDTCEEPEVLRQSWDAPGDFCPLQDVFLRAGKLPPTVSGDLIVFVAYSGVPRVSPVGCPPSGCRSPDQRPPS